MTSKEVLEKIKPLVIADAKESGIPASLTAAQMILESGWLKSGLTVKANNAFGIKGSYKGSYYECQTKEYVNGKYITVYAKFRKYPTLKESIADHSALLCRSRYAAVRKAKGYKEVCKAVQECGYATDPKYAQRLIALIEQYKLYEWDDVKGSGGICKGDTVEFTGGYHYAASSAKSAVGGIRKGGKAKVTGVAKGAKHPYHLIAVSGGGSNVYGWVDVQDVVV